MEGWLSYKSSCSKLSPSKKFEKSTSGASVSKGLLRSAARGSVSFCLVTKKSDVA
jgi:hypothetical protein